MTLAGVKPSDPREPAMGALSVRIRKARMLAKLSQADLAQRIGVKRSAVTQWEHPTGTTPSVEHLAQLAIVAGVSFEWLATGRGNSRLDADDTSAVIVGDYAQDECESLSLAYLRRLSPAKRKTALAILEILGR